MPEPYTPEELAAGAEAVEAMRHFIASDGYPAIRIGTAEEEASAVLSAVAALIAARVRAEGCGHDPTGRHGPGWCIQPDLAALRKVAGPDESDAIMKRLEAEWRARGWAPRAEVAEEIAQAILSRKALHAAIEIVREVGRCDRTTSEPSASTEEPA